MGTNGYQFKIRWILFPLCQLLIALPCAVRVGHLDQAPVEAVVARGGVEAVVPREALARVASSHPAVARLEDALQNSRA